MVVYAGCRRCWVHWALSGVRCVCSNLFVDVVMGLGPVTITVNHKAANLVAILQDLWMQTTVNEHDGPCYGSNATVTLRLH